jgi:hypothetical protein
VFEAPSPTNEVILKPFDCPVKFPFGSVPHSGGVANDPTPNACARNAKTRLAGWQSASPVIRSKVAKFSSRQATAIAFSLSPKKPRSSSPWAAVPRSSPVAEKNVGGHGLDLIAIARLIELDERIMSFIREAAKCIGRDHHAMSVINRPMYRRAIHTRRALQAPTR